MVSRKTPVYGAPSPMFQDFLLNIHSKIVLLFNLPTVAARNDAIQRAIRKEIIKVGVEPDQN